MILGATLRLLGRVRLALAVLVLALAASGCGPVGYINQVTRKADASVAAARAADAEVYAPYWFTLAVEYLHKAREEASYADFQAANRFGRKAHEAALEARKLALQRAAQPEDTSWMPPPDLRDPDGTGAGRDEPTPDARDEAEPTPDARDEAEPTPGAHDEVERTPTPGAQDEDELAPATPGAHNEDGQ